MVLIHEGVCYMCVQFLLPLFFFCICAFMYLWFADQFLPRVVELALTSGDRQTKVGIAGISVFVLHVQCMPQCGSARQVSKAQFVENWQDIASWNLRPIKHMLIPAHKYPFCQRIGKSQHMTNSERFWSGKAWYCVFFPPVVEFSNIHTLNVKIFFPFPGSCLWVLAYPGSLHARERNATTGRETSQS